jgi:hypothetical protein
MVDPRRCPVSSTASERDSFGAPVATNCSVGQPTASGALQGTLGAHHIIDPQLDPVGVPEIELGQVAMEMVLPAMLVDAEHPALEDREEPFDAVGGHVATGVLLGGMIDPVSCAANWVPTFS